MTGNFVLKESMKINNHNRHNASVSIWFFYLFLLFISEFCRFWIIVYVEIFLDIIWINLHMNFINNNTWNEWNLVCYMNFIIRILIFVHKQYFNSNVFHIIYCIDYIFRFLIIVFPFFNYLNCLFLSEHSTQNWYQIINFVPKFQRECEKKNRI